MKALKYPKFPARLFYNRVHSHRQQNQKAMEPWEELDVDDSDFPSLLRPCKRHHHSSSLHQPSQASSPQPRSSPSSSLPRLIPGPAGTVQAAMHRRASKDHAFSGGPDEEPVPTQEYIRRVLEIGGGQDDDFKANPWLFALDFLRNHGLHIFDFLVLRLYIRRIFQGFLFVLFFMFQIWWMVTV